MLVMTSQSTNLNGGSGDKIVFRGRFSRLGRINLFSSTLKMFSCPYCTGLHFPSFKKLMSHIRFIYSEEPKFSITCGDCGQSFVKFNSFNFKSHEQREQSQRMKEIARIRDGSDNDIYNVFKNTQHFLN